MIDEEELLEEILKWHMERDSPLGNAMRRRLCELIESCKIDIQPPSRIEAAIRHFEKDSTEFGLKSRNEFVLDRKIADLCHYFLTGEKDQDTWKNKDFGLEEEK